MDETHDPARRTWVESAQRHHRLPDPESAVRRLPPARRRGRAGRRRHRDRRSDSRPRPRLPRRGPLHRPGGDGGRGPAASASLNRSCGSGREHRAELAPPGECAARRRFAGLPRPTAGSATGSWCRCATPSCCCPATIGDYTDFYASVHHATNVGSMFRPDNPLLPNYKWVPIGYHGRASSIVPSGTPVRRPRGQIKRPAAEAPVFGPEPLARLRDGGRVLRRHRQRARRAGADRRGGGRICSASAWSTTGRPATSRAGSTSRSGPFLAKNFATTVSPWVVTLRGARAVPGAGRRARPVGDPAAAALSQRPRTDGRAAASTSSGRGATLLDRADARARAMPPERLSRGRTADLYWTLGADAGPPHERRLQPRARATCSRAAPSRGPRRTPGAACWSSPGAAPSRSRCRPARPGRFSRTGTR